ncbi:MAG: helix-turn-helix transcriptional regulator [Clostridia bacterium]|nr:helix-turn-helix transcriptional regulator [Clostridia bacterium]
MVLCRKPMCEFKFFGYRQFEKGEHHITRVFSESVLILLVEGVLRFEEDGKSITLTAGEYYIQRAGLFQSGKRASDEPKYFFLHMNAAFSENEPEGLPIRGKFSEGAIRALAEEYDRLYRSRSANFFALNALMFEILAELENNTVPEKKRTVIAKDIKRYIASEYHAPLSLGDIAARYGYSEDYTIKLFKKEYGTTPYQYLIKKRLQEAERLLLSTTMSVEEISRKVGYNDFSTFYRDFKKRFGVSPGEYRIKQNG